MLKKSIALVVFSISLGITAFAQNARETNAKFKDAQQPAVTADYMAESDLVEDWLKHRLDKEGFGRKSSEKGYDVYKGVSWGRVSSEKLDIYVKVDGKKGKSNVTMMVAKGYDNFVSGAKDGALISKVQDFLNQFGGYVASNQSLLTKEALLKTMEEENKKLLKEKEVREKEMVEFNTILTQKQAAINTEKLQIEELKKGLK